MDQQISDQAISTYLEQVRASGVMGKSERRLRLLEHLITMEAKGEGDTLKAYTIGLDVFEKADDFDPAEDSSVRVEMGRLRSALGLFEGSDFADTDLVVEVPVGTYRPSLSMREQNATPAPEAVSEPPAKKRRSVLWGALVAVLCAILALDWFFLHDREVASDGDYAVRIALQRFDGNNAVAAEVESALRRGLVRSPHVTVLSTPTANVRRSGADFVLRGLITSEGVGADRVDAELVNVATDRVVWAKSLVLDDDPNFDDRMAEALGNELRVRLFGASKDILEGRDPDTLSPEQLFVMATWVPGPAMNAVEWELERVALMRMALEKDPDYGAAHSVMADKLAYLANVYSPSDTEELREQAAYHAKRAMELAPLDSDVVFNVAQSQWHSGRIGDAHVSMQRVVELDPGHDLARFLTIVIPYSCAVPPGDVLREAISFDASLSADNPIRWLTLTWIAWLHTHRGDFDLALNAERRASVIFEIPYTFMRHAMLLNRLGQPDAAAAIIKQQKANWPDISPEHFANVTVPRLCQEVPEERRFIENYEALAAAMKDRL